MKKNFFVWVLAAMILFTLFDAFQQGAVGTKRISMPFSEFTAQVQEGKVSEVVLRGKR